MTKRLKWIEYCGTSILVLDFSYLEGEQLKSQLVESRALLAHNDLENFHILVDMTAMKPGASDLRDILAIGKLFKKAPVKQAYIGVSRSCQAFWKLTRFVVNPNLFVCCSRDQAYARLCMEEGEAVPLCC